MASSNHHAMFSGVPLRKQEMRCTKDGTQDNSTRNMAICWTIFASIMLVNILIYARQRGWW